MYRALETYHDRFRNQPSADALLESLWSEARRHGIQDCNYGLRLNDNTSTPGRCIKFRSWHTPWDDFYLEQNYQDHDYLVEYCTNHNQPVFWDDPVFAPYINDLQNRIINESIEFGIYGGRAYPMVETNATQCAIFNIVQRSPFDSSFKSWAGRDQELHSILTFAHLALSGFYAPQTSEHVRELSGNEKISLEKLLNNRQLSGINKINLASARKKLIARSNHEAVLQACRLGMITP